MEKEDTQSQEREWRRSYLGTGKAQIVLGKLIFTEASSWLYGKNAAEESMAGIQMINPESFTLLLPSQGTKTLPLGNPSGKGLCFHCDMKATSRSKHGTISSVEKGLCNSMCQLLRNIKFLFVTL